MTLSHDLHRDSRAAVARAADPPRIGLWQLGRLIGKGRWSKVIQARPQGCGANWPFDYAVKVLNETSADDAVAVALLQREAFVGRLVAQENLVTVLAAHVDSPPFYFVMPCLSGATLAQSLQNSFPPALPQALWIVRQTAEALEALHRQGWIHGDVKPSNIFVSPHGHVTLIDLGFARRIGCLQDVDALLGSPAYTAPESFCTVEKVAAVSDVYSLGVTLFELLVGSVPFRQTDACELAIAHLRETPRDVRSSAPQVPTRVARLVRSMLAKDPLRRPSANELVARLVELEIDSLGEWTVGCG